MVEGQTLGLIVWAEGTMCLEAISVSIILLLIYRAWSFVPCKTRPLKHLDDILNRPCHFSILISILNAQYHISTVHLGEQIIIQEGSQASNMHHSSGTRSIPYANAISSDLICPKLLTSDATDVPIVAIDLVIDVLPSRVW